MTRPLWVDPEEQAYQSLERDIEVDVAVIGAGFSGLGAAWALQESGARVAVLEARTVAGGASGRNAGFVLSGPAMTYGESVRAIGVAETAAIWAFTRENHALLLEAMETCGIECGYLRRGSMSLAASEAEWEEMLADHAAMDVPGVSACVVERASLPRPFDRTYHGGIYHAGNGELEPGAFLRGVARSLRNVEVFERTPVTDIAWDGVWKARTERGTVTAHRVILAANAYTPQVLSSVPIEPVRGQVLATAPIDRLVVPFPMYADRGYQYWRQTERGRLVVGGWRDLAIPEEVGYAEEENPTIQSALERFTAQVAGGAPAIVYRWAGIMGFTPDRLPLVGPIPEKRGLFIAAGYTGHGLAMAFLCGAQVARLAVGDVAAIPTSFDPRRFG